MVFANNVKLLLILAIGIALVYLLNYQGSNKENFTLERLEGSDEVSQEEELVQEEPQGGISVTELGDNYGRNVEDEIKSYDAGNNLAEFNQTDGRGFYRTTVGDQEFKDLSKQLDKSFMELSHGYDYYMPPKPSQLDSEQRKNFSNIDLELADTRLDHDNLINTDRYNIGVNSVGSSLKNPTYDLRAAPPNPKITVSPWGQSTYQPDYNTRPL